MQVCPQSYIIQDIANIKGCEHINNLKMIHYVASAVHYRRFQTDRINTSVLNERSEFSIRYVFIRARARLCETVYNERQMSHNESFQN